MLLGSANRSQGFGFSFDALNPRHDAETEEFTDALRTLTDGESPGVMAALQGLISPLRLIVRSLLEECIHFY